MLNELMTLANNADAINNAISNVKTFVEIGVSDFNTLEKLVDNGWEGYFVEPVKRYANKLRAKGYTNVSECAISSYNGDLKMYQSKEQTDDDMLWINGISHAVDQKGTKLLELENNTDYVEDIIIVPCYTLDEYFRVNNITKVDYLKLDVEGHETDIMQAYNWSVYPTFIKLEHFHIDDILMRELLESKGYIVTVEERDMYAVR
jgi:FkbM family methyltransferase